MTDRSDPATEATASARPLRVLYLVGDLRPAGSETHLLRLLPALDREAVRPELALMNGKVETSRIQALEARDIPVHDLAFRPGKRGVLAGLGRLRALVRERRPDLLHSFGYPCDILAVASRSVPGMRVVTSRRGNQQHPRRRLLYRLSNRFADHTICVSRSALEFAAEHDGLRVDRSTVIDNGVDTETFHPRENREPGGPRVGWHGRIRQIKGVDLLIEAMGAPEGEARLLLAGPVQDRWGEALMERAATLPHVEYVGVARDVPAFLASLDLYVLPSRSEGMSVALLEAMAAGLPIVATRVGSNAELLADGEAGELVPPDADALGRAIAGLLRDPERAAALGRAARRRATSLYAFDTMVRRYEQTYLAVAAP